MTLSLSLPAVIEVTTAKLFLARTTCGTFPIVRQIGESGTGRYAGVGITLALMIPIPAKLAHINSLVLRRIHH
jgi:hypothetical protein